MKWNTKRTAGTIITLHSKRCRNQGELKMKTKAYRPGNGLVHVLFTGWTENSILVESSKLIDYPEGEIVWA